MHWYYKQEFNIPTFSILSSYFEFWRENSIMKFILVEGSGKLCYTFF
jgi:hypothetical protein